MRYVAQPLTLLCLLHLLPLIAAAQDESATSTASESKTPTVAIKALILSPFGGSVEYFPGRHVGLQATGQRSPFNKNLRLTGDFKYYFQPENEGGYLGLYTRFKRVDVFSIGTGGFEDVGDYAGFIVGGSAGGQFLLTDHLVVDVLGGLGVAPSVFTGRINDTAEIDLRLTIALGLYW